MKQELQVESLNNCINELQQQTYAQRLEFQDAQHGYVESRRKQVRLQEAGVVRPEESLVNDVSHKSGVGLEPSCGVPGRYFARWARVAFPYRLQYVSSCHIAADRKYEGHARGFGATSIAGLIDPLRMTVHLGTTSFTSVAGPTALSSRFGHDS